MSAGNSPVPAIMPPAVIPTGVIPTSSFTPPNRTDSPGSMDDFNWDLAAESITVRIRWFGVLVGFVLVNFVGNGHNQLILNAILTLGAIYAIIDTWYSLRGLVFLDAAPLLISGMEAVFIGLLCYFDEGQVSPFRFYYFLSLLVCALRHPAWMTYLSLFLHTASYAALTFSAPLNNQRTAALVFMFVLMSWVTWATVSLSDLLKRAGRRLVMLNQVLRQNQGQLEQRISERTRQLQESQAMLVQHEKQAAFGLLAAGIAHEVGNPLAAISSLVQMLNRRDIDNHTREKLHLVDDQLRRIQRTLRELVDFSRPATNIETNCDIHEVLGAALSIAKYYKRKKGKRIITAFAEGVPRVRALRDQLVQVFLNLVLNALDATEEGGHIRISTSIEKGWLRIDIRDDGHGIDDTSRARIFQPYFTTKSTGTGLGLFVCRNIIEQQFQGRIELTQSTSQGSTFTVFLTNETIKQIGELPPGTDQGEPPMEELA
ncbi:MAG: two-component sensor histidine kinase [Planctomyces sp.]|nr:two-component sensor histidine kinase [Planctomyces sp.]